jgi:hypothetical protein
MKYVMTLLQAPVIIHLHYPRNLNLAAPLESNNLAD